MSHRITTLLLTLALAVPVLGCANNEGARTANAESGTARDQSGANGGLLEMMFRPSAGGGGSNSGISVNSFLWRASLDTISFLPLASADPFGGIIITDWYTPPESPQERFKVNIYILDRELRADGLRVTVFRQTRDPQNLWVDARVDERTARDLENAILRRARQMRIRLTQR